MAKNLMRLHGSLTALVTPFRDGVIDEAALGFLVERQARAGTTALVTCGTTGEAPALDLAEHKQVICTVVEAAARRVPVIAGCGSTSTEYACVLAKAAEQSGADALLCSAPPYVKPTQSGLRAHITAIARVTSLPVVLYDIPGRCGVGFTDETILALVESGSVIALKDASGDLSRPPRLRRILGNSIALLSGDDTTASGFRAMGGDGCISVTSNIVPALCARLHNAWDDRDIEIFVELTQQLAPLNRTLFLETNPIPVKAALEVLGVIRGELRLPLTYAVSATMRELTQALAALDVLYPAASTPVECPQLVC